MLFLIECEICPTMLIIANTKFDALNEFRSGMDKKTANKYLNHTTFKCETATIEKLEEVVNNVPGKGVTLIPDTSF